MIVLVPVKAESIVTRNDSIPATELDGELMMMSVDSGEYYAINEIGSSVWGLIEEPKSVSELCSQLREQFEVDADECIADVLEFLAKATELGIIIAK